MPEQAYLSKAQWKKIYKFQRQVPANIDEFTGGVTLRTSDNRMVHYSYTELLLCLCTAQCIQREGYVILAPIHFLRFAERVTIELGLLMEIMNTAYQQCSQHMPRRARTYIIIDPLYIRDDSGAYTPIYKGLLYN